MPGCCLPVRTDFLTSHLHLQHMHSGITFVNVSHLNSRLGTDIPVTHQQPRPLRSFLSTLHRSSTSESQSPTTVSLPSRRRTEHAPSTPTYRARRLRTGLRPYCRRRCRPCRRLRRTPARGAGVARQRAGRDGRTRAIKRCSQQAVKVREVLPGDPVTSLGVIMLSSESGLGWRPVCSDSSGAVPDCRRD